MQLDRGGWSIPSGAALDDIRIQCSLRQISHIGNALSLVFETLNENMANPPPLFLRLGDPRQVLLTLADKKGIIAAKGRRSIVKRRLGPDQLAAAERRIAEHARKTAR